ncbi:uncharacterized protein LOC129907406 isoform X2 [Episyrphus balteatus]|uniref:uncharacterized protein LOC129907406 isoform X2 n=1 Tax=Episyrphus balteatus TaxID=286459 RepID=UPI0024868E2B|nr:uncharacterized protein LOC129907406 isoform X2 [Episyrphus balteatus]
MDVPSMVQRSGDTLIVRSVVSGNQIYLDQETGNVVNNPPPASLFAAAANQRQQQQNQQQQQLQQQQQQLPPQQQQHNIQENDVQNNAEHLKDEGLPQCKIKRNYSCSYCTYFTQNPRYHLTHLRDVHGEKIVINKCKLCLYASRHYQKLVRHMKMVHGSTEGIAGNHGQSRKRNVNRDAAGKRKSDEVARARADRITQRMLEYEIKCAVKQNMVIAEEERKRKVEQEMQNLSTQQPDPQQIFQFSMPIPKTESPTADEVPVHRLLKCSLCDFTTLYRAQLVDHEQEEHCRTKFFRCDKCTYVTHIKARFSKHVKYHSMPMIKCVTCDFRTPYKWNLDRHMKNHGGAGPFKCAACDFTADIKQSLTVHEMNHHVPPVGHAAGMSLARRRNKVGGTDISDDYLSDPGDPDDQFNNNNNNIDDFDESYAKKCKYEMPDDDDDDEEQPTDLSQKGGGSDAGSQHNQKKLVRPVPNLIPIQSANNALNLSKDLASSRNSLKDIAALYFAENQIPEIIMQMDKADAAQLSPSSNHSTASKRKATSSSFFDELKKSFEDESARNENLSCNCGHISKCLSESIIHKKSCSFSDEDKHSTSISPINLTVNCNGSLRCQHCRHRCKSSADLLNHLKNCSDAGRCQNDSFDSMSTSGGSSGGGGRHQEHDDDGAGSEDMSKHPMENRVFVWNKMPEMGGNGGGGNGGGGADGANGSGSSKSDVNDNLDVKNVMLMGGGGSVGGGGGGISGGGGGSGSGGSTSGGKNEDNSYYGVETAPGYGEMTPEEEAANSSLKKVYKCPHCSFWASTASRFHVHIVGHLNKKPFECSLCAYRSNWRWDITKHIRLKTIRDPSHKNARVLMNDETGRRNYTKYNKYITLMKVTDEDGDPKLMKSGEMTPNQVASLAFLNDFNKAASESGVMVNGVKSNHSQDGNSPTRDHQQQQQHKNDSSPDSVVDTNGFMRLPYLASAMMNAAIAQQKEQQEQDVIPTASMVKRSPPPLIKPSDDLITDVKTEGFVKKTFYKCRKCQFRHDNRDAVLAHVKVHYQEPLMCFPSPSKSNHSTPLQVAVNPTNLYMNKVLAAAMCLSQKQLLQEQQQKSPNSSSSHSNNQHSILSPGGAASLHHTISPKALAAIQAAGTTIEHGDMIDEASSSNPVIGGGDGITTTPMHPAAVMVANNPTVVCSSTTSTVGGSITPSNNNIPLLNATTTTTISTPTTLTTSTGGTTSSFIGSDNARNNSNTVVMGVTPSSNFSNDSNERREPSPFRCGHCHQVSNWKHVIQRHCRLKHSGDIRIESLDRNCDAPVYRPLGLGGNGQSCHVLGPSADNYILGAMKANHLQNQQAHNNNNNNNVLSKDDQYPQSDSPAYSDQQQQQQQKYRPDIPLNRIEITRIPLEGNPSAAYINQSSSASSNKCKQQKCPSCPYISESKSQMNYHISLHKPTQYECNLCSYICTKKQHLSNHVKAMHESGGLFIQDAPAAIDLRSKHSNCSDDEEIMVSSKLISYCPKCPKRFVNSTNDLMQHLRAHGATFDFKCEACDYSTKQENILLSHSFVHTSTYQEKTEQIAASAKEDPEYPARKMQQLNLPKTGATVWVVADVKEETSSSFGDGDGGSLLKKQLETGSIKESVSHATSTSPSSSLVSETGEPEKCSHCPFQTTCNDTFKRHLQYHICVSNQPEKYTCEHCDFSICTEAALDEHTRIHFEAIGSRKSVNFFTSLDNLELIVTNDDDSRKGTPPKPINFNCDFKNPQNSDTKPDKDNVASNLRRSSRSSVHNGEDKITSQQQQTPPLPPPLPPSHKTILVNPKTGQVIRRN